MAVTRVNDRYGFGTGIRNVLAIIMTIQVVGSSNPNGQRKPVVRFNPLWIYILKCIIKVFKATLRSSFRKITVRCILRLSDDKI